MYKGTQKKIVWLGGSMVAHGIEKYMIVICMGVSWLVNVMHHGRSQDNLKWLMHLVMEGNARQCWTRSCK